MKILSIIAICFLTGCASLTNWESKIGTPAQVQAQVTVLGALVKPYLSTSTQGQIHNAAVQIGAATTVDFNALAGLLPITGNAKADAFIASIKAYLALAGPQLEYVHAIGNGLLVDFP